MRRVFVILFLACISHVANAEQITYSQVANASSIKDFKKIKITSYEASNGEVFSVGDTITIGPKSDIFYLTVATFLDLCGYEGEIENFIISKNKREGGFMVVLQLRVAVGKKLSTPLKVIHLEKAISIGEIVSKIAPVAVNESESMMSSPASGLSQCSLSEEIELVVGTTEIEIMHTADWAYRTLSCDTQKAGTVCKLAAIDVQGKGRKNTIQLVLQTPDNERIIVKDINLAIELGEIYIVR